MSSYAIDVLLSRCRVRTSSGTFLRRGRDKIIREIEKRIADYTFIPEGMRTAVEIYEVVLLAVIIVKALHSCYTLTNPNVSLLGVMKFC